METITFVYLNVRGEQLLSLVLHVALSCDVCSASRYKVAFKNCVVDGQAVKVVYGLGHFLLGCKGEISSFQKKLSPDFRITMFYPGPIY